MRGESSAASRWASPYCAIIFLPPPLKPVSEKQETMLSLGRMPAATSGYTSEMKPVAWQPGLAMRLPVLIASRCAGDSSGKP